MGTVCADQGSLVCRLSGRSYCSYSGTWRSSLLLANTSKQREHLNPLGCQVCAFEQTPHMEGGAGSTLRVGGERQLIVLSYKAVIPGSTWKFQTVWYKESLANLLGCCPRKGMVAQRH